MVAVWWVLTVSSPGAHMSPAAWRAKRAFSRSIVFMKASKALFGLCAIVKELLLLLLLLLLLMLLMLLLLLLCFSAPGAVVG